MDGLQASTLTVTSYQEGNKKRAKKNRDRHCATLVKERY